MNKDVHSIFEAYMNKRAELLGEAPIGFEEPFSKMSPEEQEKSIQGAQAEFPEQAQGKYAIDENQTTQVISKVVAYLKKNGDYSPKLYKDFQKDIVAPFVREINSSINPTNSTYTARVVYNAMRKAKIVKDETTGMEGVKKDKGYPTERGKAQLAQKIVANPESFSEKETEPEEIESGAQETDKPVNVRIKNWILDEIDPITGGAEMEVIKNVQRKIMSSGGLGLEEGRIASVVKANISDLIAKNHLAKQAGKLIFGKEDYSSESEGSEFKSEEDTIRDITGLGARPTGKSLFGGGGNSYGIDFG